MTQQEIISILETLLIVPNVNGERIRVDFYRNDELLGDLYYIIKEKRGIKKPIHQKIYILDAYDMRKVLDYINDISPIQEGDYSLINNTINIYSQDVIEKSGI